ncbi:MAG: diphosphate--fructose-6-phosphate 1-phosphotransferase [Clostridiales bacterium]|nr:diphosphate--fructose-6-phosphate 1-phosphotransferase [Clostridiales bacterium]
MARRKNAIVAQSGGPTPVINNSLRGVIDGCRAFPDAIGAVYAGLHGVEGILTESLIDLSSQPDEEIALLRTTPAAGSIGTCRYKLKPQNAEDFDRVLAVLAAHDIGYLFYIGGNDSMDTAHKLSALAHERGRDLVAVGVPKTIDNDVGDAAFRLIDHTPGYGSVARYWATAVQNADEENRGSRPADPVLVLQAMGRKIGYIPAAARLADPARQMPLRIYMAESRLTLPDIADDINDLLVREGRAVVVVSEGLDVGSLGESRDAFGHAQFGASQLTVAQALVNHLNAAGLRARGAARGQVYGTDQRDAIQTASPVDLDEAYQLGLKAAEIAASGQSGYMSTILRNPGPAYSVRYDKVPLRDVANSERTFPGAWLSPSRTDVTDDFVRYARPLIGEDFVRVPMVGGLMRFARLQPIYAPRRLPDYVPQGYRK